MRALVLFIAFTQSLVSFASDFKRNPVIYGISPRFISEGYSLKGFQAIRKRLPEIKDLGADILWLQPVTSAFESDGDGYDVVDYKKVWSELGTESDLSALISDAHKLGLKVVLDVVLNHSSKDHPFVKDILKKGSGSPYYNFYQHGSQNSSGRKAPYDNHLHACKVGGQKFVYYFWENLFNYNYDYQPLRNYLFQVLTFWVQEFHVDGFRFDAAWGPSARWPEFYPTVARVLRSINPDIILMAEDMAGYPTAYSRTGHPHLARSGFNWAYDWNPSDPDWISQWSFQMPGEDESKTVFNERDSSRAAAWFVKAVQNGTPQDGIQTVRYLENNDTAGFLLHHTLAQEAFAAKIMFLLPGVPLVFYGQEVGSRHEKFAHPSFDPRRSMASYQASLWKFYQKLIQFRKASRILSEGTIEDLKLANRAEVTFVRRLANQKHYVRIDFSQRKVFLDGKLF